MGVEKEILRNRMSGDMVGRSRYSLDSREEGGPGA